MDIDSFHIMDIVNNAAKNIRGAYVFLSEFWISLDKYPEVESLGHMIVPFFNFFRTSILFSIVAAPIYNPTNRA